MLKSVNSYLTRIFCVLFLSACVAWAQDTTTLESGAKAVVPPVADPVAAPEMTPELLRILDAKMVAARRLAEDPLLIREVVQQNERGLSLDEIRQHDEDWQAGRNPEFKEKILTSNASRVLSKRVRGNRMIYGEAFLCDLQGALVGAFPATSDYWQGDEDKFTECLKESKGVEHIGEIAYDESAGSYLVQVSVPVYADPKDKDSPSRKPVGVLVVGLKNPISKKEGKNP